MDSISRNDDSQVSHGNGVLYVAMGDSYRNEAKRALASLQKNSPGVNSCVITDQPWRGAPQPTHFIVQQQVLGFRCKPELIPKTPFERTLYIDVDSYVARDISNVFNLLDYYDIGVKFGGNHVNEAGIELHTQCCSSTILFSSNAEVRTVFDSWKQLYYEAVQKVQNVTDFRGLGDQRYLAIAIARSKARPCHLDSYLNFNVGYINYTCAPPLIYAGRSVDLEYLDHVLTDRWDYSTDWMGRVWLGTIKGVLPRGIRKSDPLLAAAILSRRIVNDIKYKLFCWREDHV